MLHDGKLYKTDCTINYLNAGEMSEEDFWLFYKFQLEMGFLPVEAPDKTPYGPSDKPETRRAVLGTYDPHGTLQLRGVIVNPPYPFAGGGSKSGLLPRRGSLGGLLTSLVAGAAVATLVSRLGRNH